MLKIGDGHSTLVLTANYNPYLFFILQNYLYTVYKKIKLIHQLYSKSNIKSPISFLVYEV